MSAEMIDEGIHPDGVQWRIRKIGEYYYYSENISHYEYGSKRWEWHVIDIHPDLIYLRAKVNKYACEKQAFMDFMKKGYDIYGLYEEREWK